MTVSLLTLLQRVYTFVAGMVSTTVYAEQLPVVEVEMQKSAHSIMYVQCPCPTKLHW